VGSTAYAEDVPAAESAAEAPVAEEASPEVSSTQIFQVERESKIDFSAKITGSSFKGESRALKGTIELDLRAKQLKKVHILLPADSIKTGMGKRDSHMYDKYLETDKYPIITFKAQNVPFDVATGSKAVIEGTFAIHGVEKPVKMEFTVKSIGPNDFMIDSEFELNIEDYGIKQPKFMVVKMNKVLKMELRLIMRKKA
jgi:polyisoprenoid-binding protein YceI